MRPPAAGAAIAEAGFSLVELVIVIAVLGILSVGTVRFLTFAADGYHLAGTRAELANSASMALARLSTELESALPNSVRVSAGCIEFVPVYAVTQYLTLPRASAASTMQIAAPDTSMLPSSGMLASARLVVDPSGPDKVYDTGSGYVSSTATFSAPDGSGIVTATFAAALSFASESPERRVYVIKAPVSFCVAGTRLFRYTGYGHRITQSLPADLPATSPDRQLIADSVASGSTPFSVLAPSLARNNIVAIALPLQDADTALELQQSVHMRYVP